MASLGRSVRPLLVAARPSSKRSNAFLARLFPVLTSSTVPTSDLDPSPSRPLDLPSRILRSALPFIPQTGFTLDSIRQGVSQSELKHDPLVQKAFDGDEADPAWLESLFPTGSESSRTVFDRVSSRLRARSIPAYPLPEDIPPPEEPQLLGLRRALVKEWLSLARRDLVSHLRAQGVSASAPDAYNLAFRHRLAYNSTLAHPDFLSDALALLFSTPPSSNSSTFPLLPHVIGPLPTPVPYVEECVKLSTTTMAALGDDCESGEWQAKRFRFGVVYAATEVASLRQDESSTQVLLDRLISASDRASLSLADLLEFARYVQRSQSAIFRSLGL